jgi:hypothetical protein
MFSVFLIISSLPHPSNSAYTLIIPPAFIKKSGKNVQMPQIDALRHHFWVFASPIITAFPPPKFKPVMTDL